MGLQNRLPLTKQLSVELGIERGFHLLGPNQSFNSGTVGLGWQPTSDFRASARYEYRDRGGVGQLFAVATAGKLREGVTALSRFQFSRGAVAGKSNQALEGMAALAIRPLDSDRTGLLFSYTHRSTIQNATGTTATRDGLKAALALHFAYYNYCRVHRTIKTTPAVAAGCGWAPSNSAPCGEALSLMYWPESVCSGWGVNMVVQSPKSVRASRSVATTSPVEGPNSGPG